MKCSHCNFPATPGLARAFLVFGALVIGSATSCVVVANEPPGVLTLYQTIDGQEQSCSFDVPGPGSGTVIKLLPKRADGPCPKGDNDDSKDDSFKPHAIRIRQAPAAAKFLLTNNERCEKNDSAWIELETTRPVAALEKIGLDKITDYRGYITNSGTDSGARSLGFKLLASEGRIDQGKLSCIRITTSSGPSAGSK